MPKRSKRTTGDEPVRPIPTDPSPGEAPPSAPKPGDEGDPDRGPGHPRPEGAPPSPL